MKLNKIKKLFLLNILILIIVIFIPFILTNNLITWDADSHIINADFIKENTWPKVTVWNPYFFNGFMMNQFYPPIYYFFTSTMGFLFDLTIANKIILIISYLLFFTFAYFYSKSIGLNKNQSKITLILIFFLMILKDFSYQNAGFLGITFSSTLIGGLSPTILSAAFLFLFLYSFEKKENKYKSILSSIFLSGAILSHFIGLIGIVYLISSIIYSKIKNDKKEIYLSIKIIILSILLSSFWLFPAIKNFSFSESTKVLPDLNFINIIFLILYLFFSIEIIKEKKRILKIVLTNFLILVIIIFGGILFNAQIFRLSIIFCIFTSIIILYKIKNENKLFVIGVFLTGLILLGGINYNFETNYDYNISLSELDGTILVTPYTNNIPSRHDLAFLEIYKTDNFGAKGLFVESSLNSKYVSIIETNLYKNSLWWGIDKPIYKTKDYNIIKKQSDILGINYLISFINLDKNYKKIDYIGYIQFLKSNEFTLEKDLGKRFDYFLYKLSDTNKIEPLKYNYINTKLSINDWKKLNTFWFINPGNSIFVNTEKRLNLEEGEIRDFNYSKDYQSFSFYVDSNEPIAVYIKQSYYPTWRAINNGKEIPIYLASPNNMIVEAKGKVTFYHTNEDKLFGAILSIIGILIIIIELLKNPSIYKPFFRKNI